MINEVELDYLEDDVEVQWVELYNSGPGEVDVSGWAIISEMICPERSSSLMEQLYPRAAFIN